jgi:hypothetical protein
MSLVNTLTQPLKAKYEGMFDSQEHRLSQYGVMAQFMRDTPNLLDSDAIAKAKASIGNTLSLPVLNDEIVTVGNVRSCTVPLNENTSELVTLTWTTYVWGFTMFPSQYANNDIKYQEDFDKSMLMRLKKVATLIDAQAITQLETDKSLINNSSLVGVGSKYGALVGSAIQVTSGQRNLFFNDLETIMNENDHYGRINVDASTSMKSTVNFNVNQGNANSQNNAFQFGPYDYAYSNRVANGAGVEATGYAMPEGSVALLTRNTPDAITGQVAGDGTTWELIDMPIIDMVVDSKYSSNCADGSALQGGSQAHLAATNKESFQFSVDVATISAYNSDPATRPGSIYKFEMLA